MRYIKIFEVNNHSVLQTERIDKKLIKYTKSGNYKWYPQVT